MLRYKSGSKKKSSRLLSELPFLLPQAKALRCSGSDIPVAYKPHHKADAWEMLEINLAVTTRILLITCLLKPFCLFVSFKYSI